MAKPIITASELTTWGICGWKHHLSYKAGENGAGLTAVRPYVPYIEGRLLHHVLEIYARTGQMKKADFQKWYEKVKEEFITDEQMLQDMDKRMAASYGACLAYREVYPDEPKLKWIGLEQEFQFELPQCICAGRLDGFYQLGTGQYVLRERKFISKSWASKIISLPLNIQRWFYIMGVYALTGEYPTLVEYDYIFKTQIRLKKDETEAAFERRVVKEYISKPTDYFYRDRHPIEIRMVEGAFNLIIAPRLNAMVTMKPDIREEACISVWKECEFLPACIARVEGKGEGWDAPECTGLYRQKEKRHEELG